MAATAVLADSSFYISMMRQRNDPLRALAVAAASRDLAICGVVRCEVGRAIVAKPVWEKFQAAWDVMINVPTDNRLWSDVEKMIWELDRQGKVLPLTDVIIACCAIRICAVVLTLDAHFYDVPGLRVIRELEF